MSEVQLTAVILILLAALPVALSAWYIEKKKNYHLISGWDASKISDADAYVKLICRGLYGFALLTAIVTLGPFLFEMSTLAFAAALAFAPLMPLVFYITKANKLYRRTNSH